MRRVLEVTHEATTQVKESRVRTIVYEYEMFEIKSNKSIIEMITRFTYNINGLKSLGSVYDEFKYVKKVLK